MWRRFAAVLGVFVVLTLSGCGYNEIQTLDESTKSAWPEVLNQYQRRADLIPTLVNTVKGYAQQERDVTSALSRLLVVTENYPQLKSDANFRELQAQLEGTENRITVARRRYIDSVQQYNVAIRQFPVNLTATVFGYKPKPQFAVEN